MPPGGTIVANVGDPGVAAIVERLAGDTTRRVVPVTLDDGTGVERTDAGVIVGRIVAADPAGTTMELRGLTGASDPMVVRLPTAGRTTRPCARRCVAASQLGMEPAAIAGGLASFPGVGRRLERKGEVAGVVVYDDYGHHPTAIRETIAAVRQREPGRRVWAVYEPLTFHRTAAPPRRVRDGAGRRGRRGDRGYLGRARPGHDGRIGRDGSPMRWPVSADHPGRRAGLGGGDRGVAGGARSRPAMSCS